MARAEAHGIRFPEQRTPCVDHAQSVSSASSAAVLVQQASDSPTALTTVMYCWCSSLGTQALNLTDRRPRFEGGGNSAGGFFSFERNQSAMLKPSSFTFPLTIFSSASFSRKVTFFFFTDFGFGFSLGTSAASTPSKPYRVAPTRSAAASVFLSVT